jgi:hypothetical protein
MNRAYLIQKIWYESYLPVFLEKFVLPVLATAVIALIVINPLKWDWRQRGSLFLGVMFLAYFVVYTLYNSAPKPAGTPFAAPFIDQNAKDSNCSNVIANGQVKISCAPASENTNAPKQPPPQKP